MSPSLEGRDEGEVDELAVDGACDLPYGFEGIEVTWRPAPAPIPIGIWRSVGHSANAFAVECMVDELASALAIDPVRFRRERLRPGRMERAVLDRAASMAGWDHGPLPGRARGVAVHACFGSACAMVAEVSVDGAQLRVHRVWAAVDCGRVINPDTVIAQIEGGIVFGLSAALYGEIHVSRGAVVESNFHDAPLLRMDEMPEVEVAVLERDRPPTGVGELGVPPIAPAVSNAIFAATGRRIRRLPIRLT